MNSATIGDVETAPTVELHGTLGVRDLARIQYFHALRLWPLAAIVMMLLVGMLSFNFATAGDPEAYLHLALANAAPFEFLLVAWIVVVVGVGPYFAARRNFAQHRELQEPTTYTFNAEGIVATTQSSNWRIDWGLVKRVRETKSAYIVYRSPKLAAMLVPKRFFRNESEMTQWRQIVTARIIPRQIEKAGFVARWC
jgi:hypothetical protein